MRNHEDRTGRVVRNVWGSPHFFAADLDRSCDDSCRPVPDDVAVAFIWGHNLEILHHKQPDG